MFAIIIAAVVITNILGYLAPEIGERSGEAKVLAQSLLSVSLKMKLLGRLTGLVGRTCDS